MGGPNTRQNKHYATTREVYAPVAHRYDLSSPYNLPQNVNNGALVKDGVLVSNGNLQSFFQPPLYIAPIPSHWQCVSSLNPLPSLIKRL